MRRLPREAWTLARGQASRGRRRKASSGAASPGWLARRRRDQGGVHHEVPVTQAMTTEARQVPGGRWRMQCPCFLFGAKGASTGAEYRGIRQRFPYWCNKTKTQRRAGRRSPWSPRQRHHQSLWQAKTTFCQDNLYWLSPFELVIVGSLPAQYLGRGPGPPPINRTSHPQGRGI